MSANAGIGKASSRGHDDYEPARRCDCYQACEELSGSYRLPKVEEISDSEGADHFALARTAVRGAGAKISRLTLPVTRGDPPPFDRVQDFVVASTHRTRSR